MWTAVIPLKGKGERKTRLAGRLGLEERWRLTQDMFGHVVSVLRACPEIGDVALLSTERPQDWTGPFMPDGGQGLNAELGRGVATLGPGPLLVIHADLPLLSGDDIEAFLAAAQGGCAIAPDRLESGTNAVALRDSAGFDFAFGPDSFRRHLHISRGRARVVRRSGLALDIDTPEDLDAAIRLCPGLAYCEQAFSLSGC